MTNSDDPAEVNYRDQGTRWASQAQRTMEDAGQASQDTLIGLAQATALLAIYCELRHGNDQQSKHLAAMNELIAVVDSVPARIADFRF